MQYFSVIDIATGLFILLGCCVLLRSRLPHQRFSDWAAGPTLTTVLLGFAVIVLHLLIAKMIWGFSWAGVVAGIPLVAFVALGMGYFYVWYRRH